MKRNIRSAKQKAAAVIAMALVLAGGAIAAVSATGADRPSRAERARHHAAGVGIRYRDLAAAAAYLGLSPAQLEGELRAGRSLGQIAEAIPGRSPGALIEALVASRRQRLDALAANVPRRVRAEVNRKGRGVRRPAARRSGARFRAGRSLGAAAAAYLGLSPHQLRPQLRAGRTLAEIAVATPGKSVAGLIDALVAAKKQRVAARAAAGRLGRSQADRANRRAEKLITGLVHRGLRPHHRRLVRR